jgi:hypothetical protein
MHHDQTQHHPELIDQRLEQHPGGIEITDCRQRRQRQRHPHDQRKPESAQPAEPAARMIEQKCLIAP